MQTPAEKYKRTRLMTQGERPRSQRYSLIQRWRRSQPQACEYSNSSCPAGVVHLRPGVRLSVGRWREQPQIRGGVQAKTEGRSRQHRKEVVEEVTQEH